MNYTWDEIILIDFIKASKGDLSKVSKDGKLNEETQNAWFKIQDEYIATMDSESIDVKRFKSVCYKYADKLRQYILNPNVKSKLYNEVNSLFIEKNKLSKAIFNNESVDWDENIAKVTVNAGFRIIDTEIRAKEFFNLIKIM